MREIVLWYLILKLQCGATRTVNFKKGLLCLHCFTLKACFTFHLPNSRRFIRGFIASNALRWRTVVRLIPWTISPVGFVSAISFPKVVCVEESFAGFTLNKPVKIRQRTQSLESRCNMLENFTDKVEIANLHDYSGVVNASSHKWICKTFHLPSDCRVVC